MKNPIYNLINQLDSSQIDQSRKNLLEPIRSYLFQKIKQNSKINLNFICTHNSRRSQLCQIWAKVIADFYGLKINSFSGGIEITACNKRIITSLKRMNFKVTHSFEENPQYHLNYDDNKTPALLFSKIYDDAPNPKSHFAAILTCSHADKNCPIIQGAEKRFYLPYEDPKSFDDTIDEAKVYDECSIQIAKELKFLFSELLI